MLAARRTLGNTVKTLPPLAAWYDASQITGVADGTQISTWNDLSGNGWTLTQATGANQPTYYNTTAAHLIHGHPAVYFAGLRPSPIFYMSNTGFSLAYPFSVVVVSYLDLNTTPGKAVVTDGHNLHFAEIIYNTTVTQAYQFQNDTGSITAGTIDLNPHLIIGVANDAPSSLLSIDGTTVGTTTIGTGGWTSGIFVGTDSNITIAPLHGGIGEIRLYAGGLTTAQIASLHTALSAKWGTP